MKVIRRGGGVRGGSVWDKKGKRCFRRELEGVKLGGSAQGEWEKIEAE